MKELITRSLSGLLYISILLVSIFLSPFSYIGVLAVFGILCIYEFQKLIHLNTFWLYIVFIILLTIFHSLPIPWFITLFFLIVTIITQLFLVKDLIMVRIIPMFEKRKYRTSIFFLTTSIIFLTLIPFYDNSYNPIMIAGPLALIWTNDTFAYLIGKNFGKHKLLQRISPKKTIEGFMGGLVFTVFVGYFIAIFSGLLTIGNWLIISIIMSIFGTLGDLIQSKFKRQAGVKDSGTIMPGHGGVFDRLDSILFASPFLYAFLQIIKHVS